MSDGSVGKGNNFNQVPGGDNVIGAGRFKKAGSVGDVNSGKNITPPEKKDISRSMEADSGKPIQVASNAQKGMVLAGDFNPIGKGNFIQLQGGKTDNTKSENQPKLTALDGGKKDKPAPDLKVITGGSNNVVNAETRFESNTGHAGVDQQLKDLNSNEGIQKLSNQANSETNVVSIDSPKFNVKIDSLVDRSEIPPEVHNMGVALRVKHLEQGKPFPTEGELVQLFKSGDMNNPEAA